MVWTSREGRPKRFGESAPTGQRTTHSPHDSHTDSMKGEPPNGLIWESNPRREKSIALAPTISSQVRTQIPHSTHLLGSKVKNGLESSTGRSWCTRRRRAMLSGVTPTWAASVCSVQSLFAVQSWHTSGWSVSNSSVALRRTESICGVEVVTAIPSVAGVMQEATMCPPTSTMHMRHAPTGSRSGW
jgi:hypothetical protein